MGIPGDLFSSWKRLQSELSERVRVVPLRPLPRLVAAADCAFSTDGRRAFAVALVWDRLTNQVVDQTRVVRPLDVPYLPGFLSFREGPAILDAITRLQAEWEVVCFDGHGLAHPRRCGLATHLGVLLDRPAVGFAKSRLVGSHDQVPRRRGQRTPLHVGDEVVGAVLCTRDNVRPIYVSVGNLADLDSACELALACGGRYRIPEPTRLADRLVADLKRSRG
jgi:deoxyribonuclease V